MTATERIIFVMPSSRELQFPAMAIVQEYVNTFQAMAKNSDASRGVVKEFVLSYSLIMDIKDFDFFARIGLRLDTPPSEVHRHRIPDMLVDMSDERLNTFQYSGKHASAVCAILAGVQCGSVPKIKALAPRLGSHRWLVIGEELNALLGVATSKYVSGTVEDLLTAQDQDWSGIIAVAGWETYLAASMGIGVVEIAIPRRPVTWLSKFINQGYRVVDGISDEEKRRQIERATISVEHIK